MSDKKVIVHFIWRGSFDIFPVGYINFMKLCIPEHEHHFFVKDVDGSGTLHGELNVCDQENVHYYGNLVRYALKPENFRLLRKCHKIIVSGWCLSIKERILLILSGLISKTYFHFWDVAERAGINLKTAVLCPRQVFGRILWHILIKKSAGTINLIKSDLEALNRIYPSNTKHFIAPMPADPLKQYDFASIREKAMKDSVCRIIVGHSAHASLRHIEVFRLLAHLKDENIKIVCPLSYGNSEYRDKVIAEGRSIFEEKFIPIVKFINKDEYINFLASCDVGIFMIYGQQAMGNISLLLRLGKKVYLIKDEGNRLWQEFSFRRKFSVYPVSELDGITLEQLVNFPQELAYNNIHIAEEYAAGDQAVTQWRKVFED